MNKLQYEIVKFKGIVKDITPVELMNGVQPGPDMPPPNVWTHGKNVHFDNESTHRVGGYAPFTPALPPDSFPIFGINVLTPTQSYWIWVNGYTSASPLIYVTDGVNHFNITPAIPLTGGLPGEWSGCVLNGVPVINNGVDAPLWWDGDTSNDMQPLPDWPVDQRCKAIRAYKYHLIAMNLTRASIHIPEQYAWSAGADPGTIPSEWTPTASNDAGDNILATGDGGILDGLALRDDFIVYKAHSTHIMSYIGGQFVFTTRKLFNTSGIQALNCVQELRGHHWVFTDDDMIKHDGNTFQSIADKRVRQFILNGVNPDTQLLAHVTARVPTDEIWFCFPTVDNTRLNLALIYSFTDGAWGTRELPDVTYIANGIIPTTGIAPSWDDATTTWVTDTRFWSQADYSITNDNLLMFHPGQGIPQLPGRLYNVDASDDNDGEPVEAMVERTDWTIGGESAVWDNVLIRSIYPTITGAPGDIINVQVAGTSIPGQPIPWSQPQPFTIGVDTLESLKIDAMSYGRYLNIRFSSTGGAPWEIHRIGIEYVPETKF